jgi:hypothetical protein
MFLYYVNIIWSSAADAENRKFENTGALIIGGRSLFVVYTVHNGKKATSRKRPRQEIIAKGHL